MIAFRASLRRPGGPFASGFASDAERGVNRLSGNHGIACAPGAPVAGFIDGLESGRPSVLHG